MDYRLIMLLTALDSAQSGRAPFCRIAGAREIVDSNESVRRTRLDTAREAIHWHLGLQRPFKRSLGKREMRCLSRAWVLGVTCGLSRANWSNKPQGTAVFKD